MIGIQRLCGPATKKMQPIVTQINDKNGRANGAVQEHISSSYTNQLLRIPFLSFYPKLKRSIWKVYSFLTYQINRCIRKFKNYTISFLNIKIIINHDFQKNLAH